MFNLNSSFEYSKTNRFYCINEINYQKTCKKIYVDLECQYTRAILLKSLAIRDFCEVIGSLCSCDASQLVLQFCDFERLDWLFILNGQHEASSYFIRKGLSRKAQLAMYIKKYNTKHPRNILINSVPFTVILDTWEAYERNKINFGNGINYDFGVGISSQFPLRDRIQWCLDSEKEIVEHSGRLDWYWILKPSVTNKGIGIKIVRHWNEILDVLETEVEIREWVLQKYISQPMLLDGFKYHLRVYVLCVGALKVYVFNQILVLVAAHEYDLSDLSDIYRHLTNTARSVENASFDESRGVRLLDDLSPYFSKMCETKGKSAKFVEFSVQTIRSQIHEITRCVSRKVCVFSLFMSNE